jgi:integrase
MRNEPDRGSLVPPPPTAPPASEPDTTTPYDALLAAVCTTLQQRLDDGAYATWIADTHLLAVDDDRAVIGTPLQANNMLKRSKRELTNAGFPADDIHFYHFRHFFRELAAERIAPHVVSDLMGHTDTKVTFEVNGRHVSDHAKREAATAMDDIWSQTG